MKNVCDNDTQEINKKKVKLIETIKAKIKETWKNLDDSKINKHVPCILELVETQNIQDLIFTHSIDDHETSLDVAIFRSVLKSLKGIMT